MRNEKSIAFHSGTHMRSLRRPGNAADGPFDGTVHGGQFLTGMTSGLAAVPTTLQTWLLFAAISTVHHAEWPQEVSG